MKGSIVGASGYVGGELLRLLLHHPEVELHQVTSECFQGKMISTVHPNLRNQTTHRFCSVEDLEDVDLLFTALPHTTLMEQFDTLNGVSEKLIDLSADFRLKNPEVYRRWYGVEHSRPELLERFVYGIVELHREEIKKARYVSGAGCNATAVILSLYPLIVNGIIDTEQPVTVEAKCGSSQGGNTGSPASHHPERSGCVRPYKPTGHRHTAEIIQELGTELYFSATAIEMVRGISITANLFLNGNYRERDIWALYRKEYGGEPFIRIVKSRTGIYRYPEPKILTGANYCDIGFELDEHRLVVIGAIDNLMKGAAGQAVHAMNVMCGFDEKAGLEFTGVHPI